MSFPVSPSIYVSSLLRFCHSVHSCQPQRGSQSCNIKLTFAGNIAAVSLCKQWQSPSQLLSSHKPLAPKCCLQPHGTRSLPAFASGNVVRSLETYMQVKADRPVWYLSVICGALLRVIEQVNLRSADYLGFLEKGQLPPARLTLTSFEQQLVLEGAQANSLHHKPYISHGYRAACMTCVSFSRHACPCDPCMATERDLSVPHSMLERC